MADELCPKCGAYWECDCEERYEPLTIEILKTMKERLEKAASLQSIETDARLLRALDRSYLEYMGPA